MLKPSAMRRVRVWYDERRLAQLDLNRACVEGHFTMHEEGEARISLNRILGSFNIE